MKLLLTFWMIIIIMMLIIIMIIPLINIQKNKDREKNSPFECGFDPMSNSRISFSIQFFTVSLMFLIFDIEISILMPMPVLIMMSKTYLWIYTMAILVFTLLMGLILEWKEGSMNWK
uniref:NADH-ubiquinone oxidoreductase chain 3 n=1 Tax=Paracarsidara gigantea TaxID=2218136 RepID=A0A344A2L4_9HEMI|nr:NADH dehydrogenase subunit 3 [Paracarsidara gigantea]AWU49005.1 NADH dehydrogenase subunit 3 [Paracarsidara gigantea]